MEDLAPSAIPPASKWEKTPSDDGQRERKHRRPPEKQPDDAPAQLEDAETHNLDELA